MRTVRRISCQLALVLTAAIVSCSAPRAESERARVMETARAGDDITSQPVRYPFRDEAETPRAPALPGEAGKTAEVPAARTPVPVPALTPVEVERTPGPVAVQPPVAVERPPGPAAGSVLPPITPEQAPAGEAERPEAPPTDAVARALDDAVLRQQQKEKQGTTEAAGAPLRLTLQQAVNMAVESNLKLSQQQEVIAEAEARLREKQNEYGPRLQFDYTIWTWHGIFVSPVASDPDVPVEGTGRAELTLLMPVWVARESRDAAVKQAMEEIKVRRQDYELKRNEVMADVVKGYLGVLEADEALVQTQTIVDLNRERLQTLNVLHARGQILKNRLILGEKFLASANEELKFRQGEKTLAVSRLKKLLRLAESLEIALVKPEIELPEAPLSSDARYRSQAASPLLRRLHHERMSAYWTGQVRRFEEPQANIAVRYGASFPNYDEFTDDFVTVGLSVNWPIAKFRLDRAKRDQARHRVRQLEIEEDIVSDQLDLGVQEALSAYVKSLQRFEARRLEVSLADENLRLSQAFRKHGAVDTQLPEDVFQVQVNSIALAQARMDLVKVEYEAVGNLANLYARMNAMNEMVWMISREAAAPVPVKESPAGEGKIEEQTKPLPVP